MALFSSTSKIGVNSEIGGSPLAVGWTSTKLRVCKVRETPIVGLMVKKTHPKGHFTGAFFYRKTTTWKFRGKTCREALSCNASPFRPKADSLQASGFLLRNSVPGAIGSSRNPTKSNHSQVPVRRLCWFFFQVRFGRFGFQNPNISRNRGNVHIW